MRKSLLCVPALLCIVFTGLSVLAQDEEPEKEEGVKRLEVPEKYAKLEAPDLKDADRIAKGKKFYTDPAKANCNMCHGDTGKADGPLAAAYADPAVPDLTTADFQDAVTDQYIFWRIKEPVDSRPVQSSGMLGWPSAGDDDVWAVVAYVRSLKSPTVEILTLEAYEAHMGDLKNHWNNVKKHSKAQDTEKTLAAAEAIAAIGPKLKGYDGEVEGKKIRDEEDFKKFCDDITTAAADYAKLVKDGKWDKAGEIQGKIGEGCKACHDKYRE